MLDSLKIKFLKLLKSKKLNVFGLFLLLAFLLLVITKLSKSYIETIPLKFQVNNLPKNYVLTNGDSLKVDLVVSSYGFNLVPLLFSNHTLNIDFNKDLSHQQQTYIWDSKHNLEVIKAALGNNVTIQAIKPETMVLNFETLAVKKVPVVLKADVNFALGYNFLEGLQVQPDSVNVIGAQNSLKAITAVNTQKFALKEVNTNIKKTIALQVPQDKKLVRLSTDKVLVQAAVEKFTEGTLEVPITIKNIPENLKINYFPKTVKIAYYLPLSNFKDIKPLDFKVDCDFSEATKTNQKYLTPQLVKKPKLVKSAKINQQKIEYIVLE